MSAEPFDPVEQPPELRASARRHLAVLVGQRGDGARDLSQRAPRLVHEEVVGFLHGGVRPLFAATALVFRPTFEVDRRQLRRAEQIIDVALELSMASPVTGVPDSTTASIRSCSAAASALIPRPDRPSPRPPSGCGIAAPGFPRSSCCVGSAASAASSVSIGSTAPRASSSKISRSSRLMVAGGGSSGNENSSAPPPAPRRWTGASVPGVVGAALGRRFLVGDRLGLFLFRSGLGGATRRRRGLRSARRR